MPVTHDEQERLPERSVTAVLWLVAVFLGLLELVWWWCDRIVSS